MSKLLSTLPFWERFLIVSSNDRHYTSHTLNNDPTIRAALFPLVNLLYAPIRLFFAAIENILLFVVFSIHTIFSWLATIVWFLFQLVCYTGIESVIKAWLSGLDQLLAEVLPSWCTVLFSGFFTVVATSALRSYWYGYNFWSTLKWFFIVRVGLWALVQGMGQAWQGWKAWQVEVERKRLQRELGEARLAQEREGY
jgi:hypothetical protein